MWNYHNPSKIIFKTGILDNLKSLDLIPKKKYCIFTYPDKIFKDHIKKITDALGAPLLIIDEISPNPDYKNLEVISKKYQKISAENQQIVCLGGGSVIDSAKFIAFGLGDFNYTVDFLEKRSAYKKKVHPDLISIPTTAGTGSELTSWATIWDSANQKKYSLAHECLYSKMSIFDSNLMLTLPKKITL
jgi:alcohol dehydrogenase class IV